MSQRGETSYQNKKQQRIAARVYQENIEKEAKELVRKYGIEAAIEIAEKNLEDATDEQEKRAKRAVLDILESQPQPQPE